MSKQTTYYARLQTTFSFGEEDLYDFVNGQPVNNTKYIKKLIREEMIRQAKAQGNTNAPALEKQERLEQTKQENAPRIELGDGGVEF